MTTIIAYWLLPAELARSFFANLISELADRFDAPNFDPHLTIFLAPENSRAPEKVLAELGAVSIKLTSIDVGVSEQFTKTLFVRFEKTKALQDLNAAICQLSGAPENQIADPHVSLLYKYLPAETKRELASSIKLPFREVEFNSICAMRCASPTSSAADVRAWKSV
jgi:putative hydrolase of the HAD superfamily